MQIREAITEFHFDCQVRKLLPKTIKLYDRQLEYLAAYMEQETGIYKYGVIVQLDHDRALYVMKF